MKKKTKQEFGRKESVEFLLEGLEQQNDNWMPEN